MLASPLISLNQTAQEDLIMSISEIIAKLVQFNKTERQVFVTIYERDSNGDLISKKKLPVDACFSHNDESAELVVNIPSNSK